ELRAATSFPPRGRRSLSLAHRAARFGAVSVEEFMRTAEDDVVSVAQIESRSGVAALPLLLDSAAAPDVWFLGRTDLSSDLGHPGDHDHPEVRDAVDRAVELIEQSGATLGVYAHGGDDAARWLERGARMVVLGSDVSLLQAAARAAVHT